MSTLIVLAKAPVPGRVKTRLTPPFTPRRERISIRPQPDGGLDRRLAAALTAAGRLGPGPALLIGMDTPQVTASLLDRAFDALLVLGVPMSTAHTGAIQHRRLPDAGLDVFQLPELRDVDTAADAHAVAALAPGSHFARRLAEFGADGPDADGPDAGGWSGPTPSAYEQALWHVAAGSAPEDVTPDGNIGIGGDPHALLRRIRELLRPGGEVVVETAPDAVDERLSLRGASGGATIPWARIGTAALVEPAVPLGFSVAEVWHNAGRHFAALRSASAYV